MRKPSLRRITKYEGLYGERRTRPDGEYLFSELLETRSQYFEWNIQPHIHPRLYQVFFIEKGSFVFYQSSQQLTLKGPCLIVIPPTALHGFTFDTSSEGRILTISDKLLEQVLVGFDMFTVMLGHVQWFSAFPEHCPPARVQMVLKTIDEEVFSNYAERERMLYGCLEQLFLLIYRLWQNSETTPQALDNKTLAYFRRFQQRLREVGITKNIAELASELGITTVHLNRICKTVAGTSASKLVQEHVLEEAKKYLKYTTYSVSEIAYVLHFEYPNYFARFFRKHTGHSPLEFRKSIN